MKEEDCDDCIEEEENDYRLDDIIKNIKGIRTDVWECKRCKRWYIRLPKFYHGSTGGKGDSCEKCGCTGMRLRKEGRVIGKKNKNFNKYLDELRVYVEECAIDEEDLSDYVVFKKQ